TPLLWLQPAGERFAEIHRRHLLHSRARQFLHTRVLSGTTPQTLSRRTAWDGLCRLHAAVYCVLKVAGATLSRIGVGLAIVGFVAVQALAADEPLYTTPSASFFGTCPRI